MSAVRDFFNNIISPLKDLPLVKYVIDDIRNLKISGILNPFTGVTPTNPNKSFSNRFNDTVEVFSGKNEANRKWWQLPVKQKQGLLSYPLGIISNWIYYGVPLLPLAISLAVVYLLFTPFLAGFDSIKSSKFTGRQKALIGLSFIVTAPLAIAAVIASLAVGVGGGIFYGVAKLALYPINLLVQKAIIPVLSVLAAALLSPVIFTVNEYFKERRKKRIQTWDKNPDTYSNLQNSIGSRIRKVHSSENNSEMKINPVNDKAKNVTTSVSRTGNFAPRVPEKTPEPSNQNPTQKQSTATKLNNT